MTGEKWEPLALHFQDLIYRLAYSVLQNYADAQDVTQDVLLKLLRSEIRFRDEEHLRAWLVRVTVNRCRDLLRSPWRGRRAELPEQISAGTDQTDESIAVLEAVGKLPPKLRLAVHLYYYEQYTTSEIASLTGQSESAVRQQLSRARRRLKELLKEAWI